MEKVQFVKEYIGIGEKVDLVVVCSGFEFFWVIENIGFFLF